jgi:hypothetical protein
MPARRRSKPISPNGRGFAAQEKTIAQRHAEWVGMLRPEGPFIAVPQLAAAFPQYLDVIPGSTLDRLRLAWSEVTEAPDTLTPAWTDLVLRELLGYTRQVLGEGAGLPSDLVSGLGMRPDGVVYGPDGTGGRTERLYLYRRPYDELLTTATRHQLSPAEQAAALCRDRDVPLALLTNGANWVLVHARPNEPTTTADFVADDWLEERDLLQAFFSLLRAPFVAAGRLAELFAKSAAAQAEITDTLGTQVRQAMELLVGELSRLDRESSGALLRAVEPRQIYRGALTVMMRLVFLLYAEEHELLPVTSELYADSYSVGALYEQLQAERNLHGDQVAGLRAAAWPRLLATFSAVYGGCENDQMRIPPYGGAMFDPSRYPWLERVTVTDLVTAEVLRSLVILQRRGGAAERLSYKGLDVEQIGHVYEGLLEFSCLRIDEPYLGLIGKLEPELPLAEVEAGQDRDDFDEWLKKQCDATPTQIRKALDNPAIDEATLDAACDNDKELSARVWPLRGLLRTDLRGRPTVFPADSLIITQTSDRRATGTHYTPRKLADEIVRYTLEPLCYHPGPADGVDVDERNVRPAERLLQLKVLDPAMGSAAFLVSACRYLSERLVSAWERDGYPETVLDVLGSGFNRDDTLLEARRIVAARCIYGVDRDDAAVELGKLSLWLVTLSKDKPFSFLDHALKHGDSLVGLTSEAQVTSFHLDPATGHANNARLEGAIDEIAEPIMARVKELRREIAKEPVQDALMGAALTAKLIEADNLTERLRVAADAVIAAGLSTAGQAEKAFNDRLTAISENVLRLLHTNGGSPLERAFREQLEPWLKGPRAEPIHPFHWPLEFPEVMDAGGFSAVVSNPPFMGGQTLTGRLGEDLREYLISYIGRGKRGSADLCSYFLLRDLSVARKGRIGIIATNTIAQGDTREVGLDQAVDVMHWNVYRADKSRPWPGTAAVEVSLLWLGHAGQGEHRILDDNVVKEITRSLDPSSRVSGKPYRLQANKGKSYQGSIVLGKGFILEEREEVDALIAADPRSPEIIFPYLNGEDLNSRPDCSASRWIINFGQMADMEASRFTAAWDRVRELVKPERDANKYSKHAHDYWWQYERNRSELYSAIVNLDRVLVIAQTSRTQVPALVPPGQVFDQKLVVFPASSTSALAFRTSAFQYWWTVRQSSTMKADTVYAPSDCCDNLPCPRQTERIAASGSELDISRRSVMKMHNTGLTRLYDLIGDETITTSDFTHLREIHIEIDDAIREAYALDEEREPQIRKFEADIASAPLPSWREIDLGHGFHRTPQGTRFAIGLQARVDVLDKLLALNFYRYDQEVKRGLHNTKKARVKASSAGVPYLDDGTLFPPPEALF